MTAVIGTTSSASDGAATFTPSIADNTEIAGVIMLSPKNSEAPKRPRAARISRRSPTAGRPSTPYQRDQGHDAALAVVVRPHDQQHVRDRDDDRDRPEDQRYDPVDVVLDDRHRMRVARAENGLHRVERAGPQVAEDNPQCAER